MAANWNNVRQAIYVLGAGILGAAAALGWISADQGEQLTSALVEILGAVALIVAAANVNKGRVKPDPVPLQVTVSTVDSDDTGLPVYDGPTSTVIEDYGTALDAKVQSWPEDDGYIGRHRAG